MPLARGWACLGIALAALAVVAGSPGAATPGACPVPDAAALLRRFDELYRSSGTRSQAEVTVARGDRSRTLRMRSWSAGADHALVVLDAPARDAGTATLRIEENLWNYLPRIARTLRIPPSMMMGAWMGSDLTHDDIVREISYERDYLAGDVVRSTEPPGWLVPLAPRPGSVGLWERVEMVFSLSDEMPLLARFYDRKGRLSRTMELSDVGEVGGRRVPLRITVVPADAPGHRTDLRYLSLEFDAGVDEGLFSLASLEQSH